MVARKLVVRQEGCRDETRIKDTPIPASQGPSPKVSTTVSASQGHCLTHDPIRSISYSNCNLNLCTCLGPDLLAHTHDTIIQETVAGGSEVSGQPGIHSKTFAWKTKVKGWRYSSKDSDCPACLTPWVWSWTQHDLGILVHTSLLSIGEAEAGRSETQRDLQLYCESEARQDCTRCCLKTKPNKTYNNETTRNKIE